MTTTPFDLAAAKKKAADKSIEAIVTAAGGASNRFDKILERIANNPDLDDAEKAQALALIEENVSSFVTMVLGGKKPKALAGTPSPLDKSGKEDADLADKLDKANERIRTLEEDQAILLDAVGKALGSHVGITEGRVPTTLTKDVEKAVADKVNKAKADATPKDVVDKTKLTPKVAELQKKANALSDIHRPGTPSKKSEVLAVIDEIVNLVK